MAESLNKALYLIVDTETTGLSIGDVVYEVAMIIYDGRDVLSSLHMYVETEIPERAVSDYTANSRSYRAWKECPQLRKTREEAFKAMMFAIKGKQSVYGVEPRHTFLVGSNPGFDRRVLFESLELNLGYAQDDNEEPLVSHKMIDLSVMGMMHFRHYEPMGQQQLMDRLRMGKIQQHSAVSDVQDAAAIFSKLMRFNIGF